MATTFRRSHLIQAALQSQAIPLADIHRMLSLLQTMHGGEQPFRQWDQPLTTEELDTLRILLTPAGHALGAQLLQVMLQELPQLHPRTLQALKTAAQLS